MTSDDMFAIFILTYKRADNQLTLEHLREDLGYEGKIILLIGDDDPQQEEYRATASRYPNTDVFVFDKSKSIQHSDVCDNIQRFNTVVFVRSEVFYVARELGYTYFMILEDDYSSYLYRYPEDGMLRSRKVHDMDGVISAMRRFYESTDVTSISFSMGGDYIGGLSKYLNWGYKQRKVCNSFFHSTDRPMRFIARMNDDIATQVNMSQRGHCFLSVREIAIPQPETMTQEGGLTDMYNANGEYQKAFYTLIAQPSCVKIRYMRHLKQPIHHSVSYNNCTPCILSDDIKKSKTRITPICKEYIA
jgi:hypothetical protein